MLHRFFRILHTTPMLSQAGVAPSPADYEQARCIPISRSRPSAPVVGRGASSGAQGDQTRQGARNNLAQLGVCLPPDGAHQGLNHCVQLVWDVARLCSRVPPASTASKIMANEHQTAPVASVTNQPLLYILFRQYAQCH